MTPTEQEEREPNLNPLADVVDDFRTRMGEPTPERQQFIEDMTAGPLSFADVIKPPVLTFSNVIDNVMTEIGRLEFVEDRVVFTGNAEASARQFFDQVIACHDAHLVALRAANDDLLAQLHTAGIDAGQQRDLVHRLRDASEKSARGIERVREELAEKARVLQNWVTAFGLLTNLDPSVELDPTEPQAMAEQIFHFVTLERTKWRQLNTPPPGILSIRLAVGTVHSEHLIPAAMVIASMDPQRMLAEALWDELAKLMDEACKQPAQLGMTRKPQ